ncbi:MAG: hypothetical protein HQK96_19575 [Nitrospirae bacterium]|nr:hypothetical protein [Nitrospirota bacterium]
MNEIMKAMAANYKTTLVGVLCLVGAAAAWMNGKSDAAYGLIGTRIAAILSKDGDKK